MDAIVTMRQTLLGKAIANVLCFSNMVEDPVDLQDFADNIRSSYSTHIVASLTSSWALDGISVAFIDATSVLYSVDVSFTSGPLAGTNGTDPLPAQTALLVSTARVGVAPNRGRIYLAGFTEASLTNGRFTGAAQTDSQNLVNDWRDGIDIGASQAFLRILRRPSNVFPNYVSAGVEIVSTVGSPATIRNRRLPVV